MPSAVAAAGGVAGERFTPGSIIAGRYRLVALLGRGGMGEVYRADNVTLEHAVALKFLPGGPADAAQLARFHNEQRVARQVSHKNVCRLYDLGDVRGAAFSRWSTSTAKIWRRFSGGSAACRTTKAVAVAIPAFSTVVLFVLLRLVTKRQRAAVLLGTIAIFMWWSSFTSAAVPWLEAAAELLIVGLFTCVMIRFGLLPALIALFVSSIGQLCR